MVDDSRPKILVIGDVMLDVYRIGFADRISPEAPVPVLSLWREQYQVGGAGGAAAMCEALGADACLMAVIGNDEPGLILSRIVSEGRMAGCLLTAPDERPTTLKERIVGLSDGRHRQTLVRIDTEWTAKISGETEANLIREIRGPAGERCDLIVVSDYAKGLCTHGVIDALLELRKPILVDPPRGEEWDKYRCVSCLVPNRIEAGDPETIDGAKARAADLCDDLGLQAAIVKIDEEGAALCDGRGTHHVPAEQRQVYDVTGAGDQFLAALAVARTQGTDWLESCRIANVAAGLQVERHGCVPVTRKELDDALERRRETLGA